jgi:hypothetical protein
MFPHLPDLVQGNFIVRRVSAAGDEVKPEESSSPDDSE